MTTHHMQLKKKYPTGAQEWYCPDCFHRLIIITEPFLKWIPLEKNEEDIVHITNGHGWLEIYENGGENL